MTDPSRTDSRPDTGDDTGVRASPGAKHRRPRWLKVSLMIVIAVVVVVVVLMLTGVLGGGHGQLGPRQHGS
jgi:heme/copper-type cytochrome/quinol oxidase subunit 2